MKRVKLWLDDERPAPEGWVHVETANKAIMYLERRIVDEISLDHDLGMMPGVGCGYDVALWLEKNPRYLPKKWNVHSANPIGARKMKAALLNAERRKNEEENQ